MRLKSILSDEPRALVEALESIDIKTDEDLFVLSSELPAIYRRLPPASMTFAQLERLRSRVLDSMVPPCLNGAVELEKDIERAMWKEALVEMPVLGELLCSVDMNIIEISGAKGSLRTVRLKFFFMHFNLC